jgi:hypothetical protein
MIAEGGADLMLVYVVDRSKISLVTNLVILSLYDDEIGVEVDDGYGDLGVHGHGKPFQNIGCQKSHYRGSLR